MLQAGFILLTIALAITLFLTALSISGRMYTDDRQRSKFNKGAAMFLVLWFGYDTCISLTGIFASATFPPRIPLLLVFPAFASFAWIFTRPGMRAFIKATPASRAVYFQSFRIFVEVLIYGCVVKGILPQAASFAGYNFDIIIGITAPIIGYVFMREGKKSSGIVLAWNITGLFTLVVVVSILMRHAYVYSWQGKEESILEKGFGHYPYTYLAGFLMPLAVFLHIFSIIKTRQLMKQKSNRIEEHSPSLL